MDTNRIEYSPISIVYGVNISSNQHNGYKDKQVQKLSISTRTNRSNLLLEGTASSAVTMMRRRELNNE